MSVNSFKFVSPGVFVNEVDNSQLPRLPDATGPVIIGRAERGPAMVPVQVNSFSEFVETFGEPIAGAQADDAWRQGNRIGPTYGAFAAQAYLKNGSPVTFVRLLGHAHEDAATSAAMAGWDMPGAFALHVGDGVTADKLAAMIYTTDADAAAIDSASVSNGIISLNIKKFGAGTPATAATSRIVVANSFTAADLEDTTATITIEKAVFDGADKDLTVTFSKGTANSVYTTGANPTLVIGSASIADDDEKSLATLIANALNSASSEIALTASATNGVLIVTRDRAGVTADFTALDVAAQAIFPIADDTQGTNAVAGATADHKVSFSFDANSKDYIRSVLNTNPTLTNSDIETAPVHYFLGATFDQFLESELGDNEITVVDITNIPSHANNKKDAAPSSTPWFLSQYMGDVASLAAPITSSDLTKLFKLHSLYAGEWEQKHFKVSIMDIKAPTNNYVKYGSFTVLVRSASDTDAAPVVYERFSNVNLDPTSPRYIAAIIGDMKHEWRPGEKRYVQTGEYANRSRYLRVQMSETVDSGAANPEALPFGYDVPAHSAAGDLTTGLPGFYLRESTATDSTLSSAQSAFFGVSTDRPSSPGRYDVSYQDITRPLYASDEMDGGSLFTLDWIEFEGAAHAKYTSGSLSAGDSINGQDESSYASVLEAGYDRYTAPLFGGSDGLDIKLVEPFSDPALAANGGSAINNYAYNTISRAIDTVADPEVVECNIMTIPGVSSPGLTGKLIATCEARADALAIIDLEDDYKPRGWSDKEESQRLPDVDLAVSTLKLRAMNSSYGCAFFPWVQVRDDINNRLVWMPPSVAALGTMSSSAAKSELWFAPAGFTRGGLSAGAAGLSVTQTRLRLSSKERDKLYEANVNPIAQFPAEGIVIFGQKTLQVTPSALDRINVRRLMIHVKKEISRMASTVLFDQNIEATWNRFISKADPFLASIQTRFGLSEYKIILDNTTTTPELVDRNIVYAKIFLKPARAIEFIAIDFVITNSGASFDD